MSRSGDFVVTDRQADKTDYFTPCACARGNEFQYTVIIWLAHNVSLILMLLGLEHKAVSSQHPGSLIFHKLSDERCYFNAWCEHQISTVSRYWVCSVKLKFICGQQLHGWHVIELHLCQPPLLAPPLACQLHNTHSKLVPPLSMSVLSH